MRQWDKEVYARIGQQFEFVNLRGISAQSRSGHKSLAPHDRRIPTNNLYLSCIRIIPALHKSPTSAEPNSICSIPNQIILPNDAVTIFPHKFLCNGFNYWFGVFVGFLLLSDALWLSFVSRKLSPGSWNYSLNC